MGAGDTDETGLGSDDTEPNGEAVHSAGTSSNSSANSDGDANSDSDVNTVGEGTETSEPITSGATTASGPSGAAGGGNGPDANGVGGSGTVLPANSSAAGGERGDDSTGTDDDSTAGSTTTEQSNCVPCAQNACASEYAACSANAACAAMLACGQTCWDAADWAGYDDCAFECALTIVDSGEGIALGAALSDCSEAQCDESECLTRTVEEPTSDDVDDDPPTLETIDVTIDYSEGYLTAGAFHGYVWTETDDLGSTITIDDHEPGGPLCVRGSVVSYNVANGDAPSYALLGFNFRQEMGDPRPVAESVTRADHSGFVFNDDPLISQSQPQLQLWGPGAHADPDLRYCTSSSSRSLSWSLFSACEDLANSVTAATQYESLVFYVPGSASVSGFSFCIHQLSPLG